MRALQAGAATLIGLLLSTGCEALSPPASVPVSSASGAWTDEQGEVVNLDSFRGAPVVVSAIFTSCTVRCPLTVGKLREVDGAYRDSGGSVPILLLTLDPHTDTPERLRRFKEERRLPAHWHFLRGSDADTQRLAHQLGVSPAYDVGHIDHEVRITVLDASGRVARSYADWSFNAKEAVVR